MNFPSLADVPYLWSQDGSLRDVYFASTSSEQWAKFVLFIQGDTYLYSFDGQIEPLPSIEAIFSNREGSHLLSINVYGVTINCHFFVPEEIELDIDPREVKGKPEHEAILEFIASLSLAIGKPALLTPENGIEAPFLSFDPQSHTWLVYD